MDGTNKMKRVMLYVEDKQEEVTKLASVAKKEWECFPFTPCTENPSKEEEIKNFLEMVCKMEPAVVLIDAALNDYENRLLHEFGIEDKEVEDDTLSGFKYCKALSSEKLGIPIIVFTQASDGGVARAAIRNGADRVIVKRGFPTNVIAEINEFLKLRIPHDSTFYLEVRNSIISNDSLCNDDYLIKALDSFYTNRSTIRRFSLFTASLREMFSYLSVGNPEIEQLFMLNLVKSHLILSIVDPQLRDHVSHTGNVFWIGYEILSKYFDSKKLETSLSNELSLNSSLISSWTLAALFHDYAYLEEHNENIGKVLSSLIPNTTINYQDIRDDSSFDNNMECLRAYVKSKYPDTPFLFNFIDMVAITYNHKKIIKNTNGEKTIFKDHGILSAHRLLCMIPIEKLEKNKREIIYEAALAIVCHNYIDITAKWEIKEKCIGEFEFSKFPIISLLMFCDNIQTWNREGDLDPSLYRSEASDSIFDRLVFMGSAFISESEINEFSIYFNPEIKKLCLNLSIKYFVKGIKDFDSLITSKAEEIQRWINSKKLNKVCSVSNISSILTGKITYYLPLMKGKKKISF